MGFCPPYAFIIPYIMSKKQDNAKIIRYFYSHLDNLHSKTFNISEYFVLILENMIFCVLNAV